MVVRGDRRAADLRRPLAPELRHHLAILAPDLAPEIAGIAGAGAVPGGLGIEHHHAPPPAHQRKRGGKPHIAGPHDHHLSLRRRPLVGHVGAGRQVPPVGGGPKIRRQHVARHRPLRPLSGRRARPEPPRLCRDDAGGHAVLTGSQRPAPSARRRVALTEPPCQPDAANGGRQAKPCGQTRPRSQTRPLRRESTGQPTPLAV